ncbi:MAG: polysaccharide pyruvyl transferase family protein [Oscillospiraceae bacterium]|nr:polysaccharide pyruvyl transferase family protein [Oscillospiraceae bacterium]
MRIATLNFHKAYNYGAVFQAAALQQAIQSFGDECSVLDYSNAAVESQYNLKKIRPNKKIFSALKNNIVLLPFIEKKKQNFQNWFSQYNKTEVLEKNDLQSLNERFDKFIVGSDQVWNMKCHGADTAFLLDFVHEDKKKIAYAVSFGTYDIPPEYVQTFRTELVKFSDISVREERGIELTEMLTTIKPVVTMDPVLLMGTAYWEKRSVQSNNIKSKYVLAYQIGRSKKVSSFAKKVAKMTGTRIVFVATHIDGIAQYGIGNINQSDASPESFLSLLINAEYVVTNSFHATALSLLFHKTFYAVADGGKEKTYNSRIYNLLERYSLQDRIKEQYDCAAVPESPDFTCFDSNYAKDRDNSLKYLYESIHGEERS